MSWKKFLMIALWTLFGLVVFFALGLWLFFTATFSTYDNQKDGFHISFPRQWKAVDAPQSGVIVSFVSPKSSPLDTFQENLNISTTDLSKKPLTLEQYVNVAQDQMTSVFPNIKVQESASVILSGHQGHKFLFFAASETPTVVLCYVFIYRDVAYNITYMGAAETYLKDKLLLDIMITSLKVYF